MEQGHGAIPRRGGGPGVAASPAGRHELLNARDSIVDSMFSEPRPTITKRFRPAPREEEEEEEERRVEPPRASAIAGPPRLQKRELYVDPTRSTPVKVQRRILLRKRAAAQLEDDKRELARKARREWKKRAQMAEWGGGNEELGWVGRVLKGAKVRNSYRLSADESLPPNEGRVVFTKQRAETMMEPCPAARGKAFAAVGVVSSNGLMSGTYYILPGSATVLDVANNPVHVFAQEAPRDSVIVKIGKKDAFELMTGDFCAIEAGMEYQFVNPSTTESCVLAWTSNVVETKRDEDDDEDRAEEEDTESVAARLTRLINEEV